MTTNTETGSNTELSPNHQADLKGTPQIKEIHMVFVYTSATSGTTTTITRYTDDSEILDETTFDF